MVIDINTRTLIKLSKKTPPHLLAVFNLISNGSKVNNRGNCRG
jgi:hypothetical protein